MVIKIILLLLVTGAVVWAIKKAPFIDELFKAIITWVAIVGCAIWIGHILGLWTYLGI